MWQIISPKVFAAREKTKAPNKSAEEESATGWRANTDAVYPSQPELRAAVSYKPE